jgi:hypothetical protein
LSSPTFGVAHDASIAAPSKSIPPVCLSVLFVFGSPLGVTGVGLVVYLLGRIISATGPTVAREAARRYLP